MTIELNGNGNNQRALVFCASDELTETETLGEYVLESMTGIGDGSVIIVANQPKRVLLVYGGVARDWGDVNE